MYYVLALTWWIRVSTSLCLMCVMFRNLLDCYYHYLKMLQNEQYCCLHHKRQQLKLQFSFSFAFVNKSGEANLDLGDGMMLTNICDGDRERHTHFGIFMDYCCK